MSLVGAPIEVGDRVVLVREGRYPRAGGVRMREDLEIGMEFTITRIYNEAVVVRSFETFDDGWGGQRERSYQIDKFALELSRNAKIAPRRRLGSKPDDTEDRTYIAIDDPGIQWLFHDMGKYAEEQGYCSQYDALCARLGIPGRPREFSVSETVKGITVNASIRARSQAEAREQFRTALGLDQPPEPEGPPAPNPDFPIAA